MVPKERLGNQASMATSYHQLGILAQHRGNYQQAEHRYTQSLTIDERLGHQAGTATSYSNLGNLASEPTRV
jgi:Tetratricopeptide repeat